jgi:tRNA modification GTPase
MPGDGPFLPDINAELHLPKPAAIVGGAFTDKRFMDDTIAAISTPIGQGGIAIVRLSGPQSLAVADRVFCCTRGTPSDFPTHTVHHGTIGRGAGLLDEVLLTVMRAPKTYTKEDVVEISCHGGPLVVRSILARCLESGARLAEPGEFTKRAFLNGRLDLTQAEAVMDLIQARSALAQEVAVHTLSGGLYRRIEDLRERLLAVLVNLEAHIDFPEEDIAPHIRHELLTEIQSIGESLKQLCATAHDGRILREGMIVAIIGRPNVGKSSLMNALLGRERCIVTPIPGTTRDIVQETVSIRGIPVQLIDTAGLRNARGKIENLSVEKSHNAVSTSDLVIHVLDSSRPYVQAEARYAKIYDTLPVILALNKCDLPSRLKLPQGFDASGRVRVSAKTGDGLDTLCDLIEKNALTNSERRSDLQVVINERHMQAIGRAQESLTDTARAIHSEDLGVEIIAHRLRRALDPIGEIVGRTTPEDVVNQIFSRFCIGK